MSTTMSDGGGDRSGDGDSNSNGDDNPRPHKRIRSSIDDHRAHLPAPHLLLSLPALLIHPPSHPHHPHSLHLSLVALRKCLTLKALTPDLECRAWSALAEVGFRVVGGGFSTSADHMWANGVDTEVEKAIGKGLLIAQKHPSLRLYRHHLTLLSAHLSLWQHNFKYARSILRRLIATFLPNDSPAIVYAAHLALISQLTTPTHKPTPTSFPDSPTKPSISSKNKTSSKNNASATLSLQDIHAALDAVSALSTLSQQNNHPKITLLTLVLRLRILVDNNFWDQVKEPLYKCETALGLSYDDTLPLPNSPSSATYKTSSKKRKRSDISHQQHQFHSLTAEPDQFISFDDPFEASLAIQVLILGVVYHTHAGSASLSTPRLSHLHALCDGGALELFPEGTVQISFPPVANSPQPQPLTLTVPHPRTLLLLTFLVSATSKRDVVGRKPRRRMFAREGLGAWERERDAEIRLPAWASLADLCEVDEAAAKIKADLLSELVGVSIMRSEFDAAESNLSLLISHTRTTRLFPAYSALITLHHAHLAHAVGQARRALDCYQAAAYIAGNDTGEAGDGVAAAFVRVSARAGEIALRIGLSRGTEGGGSDDMEVDDADDGIDDETREIGMGVVRECMGMGGTLGSVGQIIQACLSTEILKSKHYLNEALTLSSLSQDNHLRALILALISSHYFHTAGEEAQRMLSTCEQLAAGLGAASVKKRKGANGEKLKASEEEGDKVGNAPLRLWVGERFLELYKRLGKENRARKQTIANRELAKIVERIAKRGLSS